MSCPFVPAVCTKLPSGIFPLASSWRPSASSSSWYPTKAKLRHQSGTHSQGITLPSWLQPLETKNTLVRFFIPSSPSILDRLPNAWALRPVSALHPADCCRSPKGAHPQHLPTTYPDRMVEHGGNRPGCGQAAQCRSGPLLCCRSGPLLCTHHPVTQRHCLSCMVENSMSWRVGTA